MVPSIIPRDEVATFKDEANKGVWNFKEYDKESVTIIDQDEEVTGIWIFTKAKDPEKPKPEKPKPVETKPEQPKDTKHEAKPLPQKTNPSASPKTGDQSLPVLWVILTAGAWTSMVAIRRRKR